MATWRSIAPLVSPALQVVTQAFDLGGGVFLGPAPEWLASIDRNRDLGFDQRQVLEEATHALWVDYEANALGELDPAWQGAGPRSRQAIALERLQLADLALWCARPADVGFEIYLHAERFENKWWGIREAATIDCLRPLWNQENARLYNKALGRATLIYAALRSVPREGSMWTAITVFLKALQEGEWQVRYLFLWIALEALFGSDNPQETTYRLSQRLGLFLGSHSPRGRAVYQRAKKGYGWRSKVAHGMRLQSLGAEESKILMYDAEQLVRWSVNRILVEADLVQIFSGKRRDAWLDELLF
jgi:hypothetical protein